MIDWKTVRRLRGALYRDSFAQLSAIIDEMAEPEPVPRRTVHWVNEGEGLGNIETMPEVDVPGFVKKHIESGAVHISILGRYTKS